MTDYKVKWIVKDKNLIKFHEDDASYSIAEGVDFDKVENGIDVDAEIKDGTVVKIAIKNAVVKKEEVKKEQEPVVEDKGVKEEAVEVKEEKPTTVIKPLTWTISALSIEKGVAKFEEQPVEKYWFPIASGALSVFKGLRKGDKVQIVVDRVDATSKNGEVYQKDGVAQAKASVKEAKEEQAVVEESVNVEPGEDATMPIQKRTGSVSKSTNESIERQVAVKAGLEMAMYNVKDDSSTKEEIANSIKYYTKVCFEAMQEA